MGRLLVTIKAWPVVTLVTIGLCFLTKAAAALLGVELPEQANMTFARDLLLQAFGSWRAFVASAKLVAAVVVIAPVLEEVVFRWVLFRLPQRLVEKTTRGTRETGETRGVEGTKGAGETRGRRSVGLMLVLLFSAALFAAAHYLAQPWPDAAFLALFFFGAAQCWLYLKTGRLWCAMLNHALFNLTNLVLAVLLPAA